MGDGGMEIRIYKRRGELYVDSAERLAHGKGDQKATYQKHAEPLEARFSPPLAALPATRYRVIITESDIRNPFALNGELCGIADAMFKRISSGHEKARRILDWMSENIAYDRSKCEKVAQEGSCSIRDAEEVADDRMGICCEQAFLYVALARYSGLTSNYVSVTRDCFGKDVQHACAAVRLDYDILVDPAYHQPDAKCNGFDIKHQRYCLLEDAEAIKHFRAWRKC